jgi:hypothetical protein
LAWAWARALHAKTWYRDRTLQNVSHGFQVECELATYENECSFQLLKVTRCIKCTTVNVLTHEMQKSTRQLEYCSETRLTIIILIPITACELAPVSIYDDLVRN